MHRIDAWRLIKRRTQAIGVPEEICDHAFRATGITAYLENGDLHRNTLHDRNEKGDRNPHRCSL